MSDADTKIALARKHLNRVLDSWDEPTDWEDLYLYGFYCLEAAVEAASVHFGIPTSHRHWKKVEAAARLRDEHGLMDIESLLVDLNLGRKAAAYGDVEGPDLDAEDIATQIEKFVDEVADLLEENDGTE